MARNQLSCFQPFAHSFPSHGGGGAPISLLPAQSSCFFRLELSQCCNLALLHSGTLPNLSLRRAAKLTNIESNTYVKYRAPSRVPLFVASKSQVPYFQAVAHSFCKAWGWGVPNRASDSVRVVHFGRVAETPVAGRATPKRSQRIAQFPFCAPQRGQERRT